MLRQRANLIEQELVGDILSAFYEVYNYYHGYGLSETIYANSLAVELTLRGHRVTRELRVDVDYKGHRVGKQRPYYKKLIDMPKGRIATVRARHGNPAPRVVGSAPIDGPETSMGL